MSGLGVHVGQKFVEKGKALGVRRVIEIEGTAGRYLQAVGWIEERAGDRWVPDESTRRRTRIAISTTFRVRYERLGEL